jgi:hypothetical protein
MGLAPCRRAFMVAPEPLLIRVEPARSVLATFGEGRCLSERTPEATSAPQSVKPSSASGKLGLGEPK